MIGAVRSRLAAEESGFTLIELLVSITVLAVGIIGLVKSFDGARNLNTVSERTELMTHIGQRHIERLHDLPFGALAHATLPTQNTAHRANQHVCAAPAGHYDWDQAGTASVCGASPTTAEPMVTAAAGVTGQAASQDWFDARSGARGTVHRYITWVNETCTGGCDASNGQDYKRITVVVLLNTGRPRTPVVLQGYAYDTEAGRVCAPSLGGSQECG